MKIVIVIPTYNEAENIPGLIGQIFGLGMENTSVLVVDDNSPDGTGRVVEELKSQYHRLECLHRPSKQGLGRAYVHGFRVALAAGADLIIEMDADRSHDPLMLPRLLAAVQNADVALGSRYVPGGKIENWNYARRLISRWGNWYARRVLALPYRDLTGGYKCYRREVLQKIRLEQLDSDGYNFQIETTFFAHVLGFRIVEIPITFTERQIGRSKFNLKIVFESFIKVWRLRAKNF